MDVGFFAKLFGIPTPAVADRSSEVEPPTEPHLKSGSDGSDHSSWYVPSGTDETVFVGADGEPALHLIEYLDVSGERILRLIDDRTGLLIGPTDRRLPKLGIWVGQLRGEYYNKAGCKSGNFEPGAPVVVAPEPTNEHDPNAVVVHDATGKHRGGYFNKQKARAMKRAIDAGAEIAAISLRGTAAGRPCENVAVLAAAPKVFNRLTAQRPDSLPPPGHRR